MAHEREILDLMARLSENHMALNHLDMDSQYQCRNDYGHWNLLASDLRSRLTIPKGTAPGLYFYYLVTWNRDRSSLIPDTDQPVWLLGILAYSTIYLAVLFPMSIL